MSATNGSATPGPLHPVARPAPPPATVPASSPRAGGASTPVAGPTTPVAGPPRARQAARPRRLLADPAALRRLPRPLPRPPLPPPERWRSLLLRVAGAGAGTVVVGGMLVGAELLAARRRSILPETNYDRVLRFEGRSPGQGRLLRLVVMGDSTTTGVGTERVEESYAAVVGMALVEHGPVEVHVVGRASARAADVLGGQLPLALAVDPDLILLVVGANDAMHVTPLREVRRSIEAVLDGCGERPVVLAGVPALRLATVLHHPLRELSDRRGRQVNRVLKRAAAGREHVHFVPLAITPSADDGVRLPGYLAADGFHPNAVGYARWALELAPALLAADPRRPRAVEAVRAPEGGGAVTLRVSPSASAPGA
jgi:lysophospholipase L1-like esterase